MKHGGTGGGGVKVPQIRAKGARAYPHRFYFKMVAAFTKKRRGEYR